MVTSKHRRSKSLTILLLPVLMCIFIMEFCVSLMGEDKRTSKIQHKHKPKPPEKDYVSIRPIVSEEQEEVIYA